MIDADDVFQGCKAGKYKRVHKADKAYPDPGGNAS